MVYSFKHLNGSTLIGSGTYKFKHISGEKEKAIPTDLTGYTIIVPAGWSATAGYGKFKLYGSANYDSQSLNLDYTNYDNLSFGIGYRDGPYTNENRILLYDPLGNRKEIYSSSSFTIKITSGPDVSNPDLIQWFADNDAIFATKYYTSSATQTTAGTSLIGSVKCKVGDLVVAAIATRDTLTLSEGWTLVSTSNINSVDTSSKQRLSWAYKYAESTTESITVTQASEQRLYINMIALQGATGVTDNGYTYSDTTETNQITVTKPSGLVLWGMTTATWTTTAPNDGWKSSNTIPIIELGSSFQQRLGIGVDQTNETSVTFTAAPANPTGMTVGCLTVQGMDKFYG